ncbi:O-methyltransferase [Treponema sp.]|uniref:O-methyltransferase n=1 Tax=Treponema sp. TaxID=166 RepID=UPI00298DC76C|nr:O-methyltransferase [Treponema sp.]MCQ2240106.1 O-methyltransferase [Treponema sp.]
MNEISEIKEYAKRNSIPIVMDKGGEFICDTIVNRGCKKILEIGSAIGYSAINFANLSPDIYVRTIEIDIDRYSRAVDNIKNCGLQDRIKITNEDALDAKIDEKFDLIFIDAAKAQYEKFFEKFKYNLSEKGVIITDNLFFHGMVEDPSLTHNYSTIKLIRKIRKFVSFLQLNPEFNTTIYDKGDGVSLSMLNPDFIQPEYKAVTEARNETIAKEIEYGHKIFSIFENETETGVFSFYRKEDFFVINFIEISATERIEITVRNMLMFVRKDAIDSGIHLIKIKLPEEYRFNGIKEAGLTYTEDGTYIHKL